MKASSDLLERLHEAVGSHLLDRVLSGEATASEVAQAVKFLKDNGIEAVPTEDNALGGLQTSLKDRVPFTSSEDMHH